MEISKRFVYIGDNSDRPNYGCRATSLALRMLIERHGVIVATVFGRMIQEPLPSRAERFKNLIEHRVGAGWGAAYAGAGKLIGLDRRPDVIGIDPVASAASLDQIAARFPSVKTMLDAIRSADAVVINGEGDMIFKMPPRRKLMFINALVHVSAEANVPVHYVNAMVSDCPFSGRGEEISEASIATLRKCASVVLRDHQSLSVVREIAPDIDAELRPDALFTWAERLGNSERNLPIDGNYLIPFPESTEKFDQIDLSRPYVALSGTSYVQFVDEIDEIVASYAEVVEQLKKLGMPVIVVPTCEGDDFLQMVAQQTGCGCVPITTPIMLGAAVLGNARVLVSGRYHPSILASLGGTPCVFLGSNSHKMLSLQKMLRYESPAEFSPVPSCEEAKRIVALAKSEIESGETRRSEIKHIVAELSREAECVTSLFSH